MTEHSEDFEQLAVEAGMPVTEDAVNSEFETLREEAELDITNTSAFGPFWRFIKEVATKPALWLLNFVVTYVLPQAFVKTATGTFLELHAWAVDLSRKLAAIAVGQLQFTRTDTAGVLPIPVGTVVQSTSINGQVYSVVTTAEVSFADGEATVMAPVEAVESGVNYNLAAGYYTVLPDNIAGVTGVTNLTDWLTTPGADKETDDELRLRIKNQYSAVNQWHTDAVYTSIIASFDGVTTDNVYFQHDAPRGAGTANAYVMLETGNPSGAFIASIQAEITDNGNHGHGDDLVVYPMTESNHSLVATIWPQATLLTAEIATLLADCENFIRAAFRENNDYTVTKTQPFDTFSFSKLGQEMHKQFPGLKNVDFDLTHIDSQMDLPRLDSLTVAQNV